MSGSQFFLEIAQKVYNSRDLAADGWGRQFYDAVIAALGETDKRRNGGNRPGEGVQGHTRIIGWDLSADLLAFRQNYPPRTLLQCVGGLFIAPSTKTECEQATEGLLEASKPWGIEYYSQRLSHVFFRSLAWATTLRKENR